MPGVLPSQSLVRGIAGYSFPFLYLYYKNFKKNKKSEALKAYIVNVIKQYAVNVVKQKSELARLTRIILIFTKYLYEFIVFPFITKIYS